MPVLTRKHILSIGSLACIQVSNALAPLVVFPYALKVLGSGPYSNIAMTESISNMVVAAVLFSFDIDGVSRVAAMSLDQHREQIGHLFSQIIYARMIIFLSAGLVALTAYTLISGHSPRLLALWLLVPLGHVFQSFWLYQGLERTLSLALITLANRVLCVIIVFRGLAGPGDSYLVPLSIGGMFVLGGVVSTTYLTGVLRLRFHRPDWPEIGGLLKRGRELFLANACVILYRGMNIILLGAAGGSPSAVSAYSIAEKTNFMLQAATRPLTQFFFPRVIRELGGAATPTPFTARLIARFTLPQIAVLAFGVASAAALAALTWHVSTVIQHYPNGRLILILVIIMLPSIFFGVGNFMFGSVGLNYLGARRRFFLSTLITGVINVAACFLLSRWLGPFGAALAFASSETILFSLIIERYSHAQ